MSILREKWHLESSLATDLERALKQLERALPLGEKSPEVQDLLSLIAKLGSRGAGMSQVPTFLLPRIAALWDPYVPYSERMVALFYEKRVFRLLRYVDLVHLPPEEARVYSTQIVVEDPEEFLQNLEEYEVRNLYDTILEDYLFTEFGNVFTSWRILYGGIDITRLYRDGNHYFIRLDGNLLFRNSGATEKDKENLRSSLQIIESKMRDREWVRDFRVINARSETTTVTARFLLEVRLTHNSLEGMGIFSEGQEGVRSRLSLRWEEIVSLVRDEGWEVNTPYGNTLNKIVYNGDGSLEKQTIYLEGPSVGAKNLYRWVEESKG